MRTHLKRLQAFTLVELLVVIGIIALLISILLPSLGRARASANLVACQSNFKQVYSALMFYANDNGGLLPWASINPNPTEQWGGPSGQNAACYIALTKYLKPSFNDETKDSLSPVFTCTEALPPTFGNVWFPGLVRTVKFNVRAFPSYDQQNWPGPGEYPQRKLVSIRNGSQKIAYWDGPQNIGWNMSTVPTAISLDGWRYSWGDMWTDPSQASWDENHLTQPVGDGPNTEDTGWDSSVIRYRHMINTTTPVAFFDGHVESRKVGTILVGELCINK